MLRYNNSIMVGRLHPINKVDSKVRAYQKVQVTGSKMNRNNLFILNLIWDSHDFQSPF